MQFDMVVKLVVAHILLDYPWQGDYMAKIKNPVNCQYWWLPMTYHALLHAVAVDWATEMPACAIIEFFAHWWIDYLKCKGKFGELADQLLHLLCKAIYVAIYCRLIH
jgi:Protein of unknown function (DUF3307)